MFLKCFSYAHEPKQRPEMNFLCCHQITEWEENLEHYRELANFTDEKTRIMS